MHVEKVGEKLSWWVMDICQKKKKKNHHSHETLVNRGTVISTDDLIIVRNSFHFLGYAAWVGRIGIWLGFQMLTTQLQ